jgi:hypothetical protein
MTSAARSTSGRIAAPLRAELQNLNRLQFVTDCKSLSFSRWREGS